jgi:hypothetical protein
MATNPAVETNECPLVAKFPLLLSRGFDNFLNVELLWWPYALLGGKYSNKDLEKLPCIKAHTIRIWEKRHRLVRPQRNHGIKISKIVDLTLKELNRKVAGLSEATKMKNRIRVRNRRKLSILAFSFVKYQLNPL